MTYGAFLFWSMLLFSAIGRTQNNYYANPPVETWQRMTVSLGNVKQKVFDKQKYKYYNILGTGVIFYFTHNSQTIPVIITAKHVLKNENGVYLDTIRIRFSWESNQSVYENLGHKVIISHKGIGYFFELPDTSIDLACVPLTNLLDSVPHPDMSHVVPYSTFARDVDYFEGRDIFTLGYPAAVGPNIGLEAY